MRIEAALPKYERYFYNVVLCVAVYWAASWIFEVSNANVSRKSLKGGLKPGWDYLSRKRETADEEWMWFSTFREHILFALSGHVIFAKICSLQAPQYRSLVFLAYGMLAVLTSMGWTYVALILSHCVLLYSVSLVKLRWLCFAAGLTTLATYRMEPFMSWQAGLASGSFELQDVLFYGGCGFSIMRCVSFALENCDRLEGSYSFLELLKYNFYLPFFYFGPAMTFDRFYSQANSTNQHRKEGEVWRICLQVALLVGAVLLVEILLHYMYILSLPTDLKLLRHVSDWAIVGLAYANLLYGWVKAAVMFALVSAVCRLDHLDPPKPPKCITMLYVYSETYFDRGIHDWLCKYVYHYLGGNHDDAWDKLVATVCTFGVTALWLGPCDVVLIWALLNCFGLNLELWTTKFFSTEPFVSIEMAMSDAMSRRIRAMFNAVNFCTIVLYNILALNGLDFAKLVAKRVFLKGFPLTTVAVMVVTYCLVQLIKENERIQALMDDPDPVAPPQPLIPPDPALAGAPPTDPLATPTAPVLESDKEKAE